MTLSSSRRSSEFLPMKFTKKKEMITVDWTAINRKLEAYQRNFDNKLSNDEANDLLFSMYDENPSDKYKRQSIATAVLNPSSVKKLKNMVKHKRETKNDNAEAQNQQKEIQQFQTIHEMLEQKRASKEKNIQKLLGYDVHSRQK